MNDEQKKQQELMEHIKNNDLRVPKFFPLVKKDCKEQAAIFFHCYSTQGKMANKLDEAAGRRGLAKCQSELQAYENCMEKYFSK